MPFLDQSNINQTFAANVAQEFCNILIDRGWLRSTALSDSTIASEQFAHLIPEESGTRRGMPVKGDND
jgi:hypothetical protein